ncbi:MAG: cytochrome c [Elusimicrobia bacterium]|nr:cytochrome c [Elusimicrobiota bacterium]
MRALLVAALVSSAALAARADDATARFDAAGCRACHRVGPYGGDAGPDLTMVGARRPRVWIEGWLSSPRHWKADTRMPEQGLALTDRELLASWLSERRGQDWGGSRPWAGLTGAAEGKSIYARAGCVGCHGPAGRGGHPNPGAHGGVIPALAPLMGTYRTDELKAKLRRGVVPETHDGTPAAVVMPPFKEVFSEDELDALSAYLLSLGEGQPKTDW